MLKLKKGSWVFGFHETPERRWDSVSDSQSVSKAEWENGHWQIFWLWMRTELSCIMSWPGFRKMLMAWELTCRAGLSCLQYPGPSNDPVCWNNCLKLLQDMPPLWCHAVLQSSGAVITAARVLHAVTSHWCDSCSNNSQVRRENTLQYSTMQSVPAWSQVRPLIFHSDLYFTKENLFAWSCFKYKELTSASRSLYARAQQAWGEGAKYPESWSWYAGPAWLCCRNILFLTPMTGIKCSSLTSIRSLFDLSSHLNILNMIPGHVNIFPCQL